jgi:tripartite-type tricarboxylate transporter receptor subunit TctC
MKWVFAPIAALAVVLAATGAAAADWPTKPVRLIVAFAAGGPSDAAGRAYAEALSAAFGQQFVVENRTGGGGLPAAEAVARAEPDGYTLLVSGTPNLVLQPAMSNVGYDAIRDFTHIAYFGGISNMVIVHPSLGVRTYQEFPARVRAEPGGFEYLSAGFGSMGYWVGEYIAAKENIKLTHVPYRGGSVAVFDLLAAHVKVGMLSFSSSAQHVKDGKLVALAAASAERLPFAPDLPTLKEIWRTDFSSTTWFSLSGPAGMPADIVERINREVIKAMDRPEVRKQVDIHTIESKAMTPAALTAFIVKERERWTPIIKKIMSEKPQ